MDGTVTLSGAVRSGDTTCGNGTAWFIDRDATPLSAGTLAPAQADFVPLPTLSDLSVNEGTRLYFSIHANGEHSCDTLVLDLVIREQLE
jgi:hypothetical protein